MFEEKDGRRLRELQYKMLLYFLSGALAFPTRAWGMGVARLTDKHMDLKYINVHHFTQFNLLSVLNLEAYDGNTEMTKRK